MPGIFQGQPMNPGLTGVLDPNLVAAIRARLAGATADPVLAQLAPVGAAPAAPGPALAPFGALPQALSSTAAPVGPAEPPRAEGDAEDLDDPNAVEAVPPGINGPAWAKSTNDDGFLPLPPAREADMPMAGGTPTEGGGSTAAAIAAKGAAATPAEKSFLQTFAENGGWDSLGAFGFGLAGGKNWGDGFARGGEAMQKQDVISSANRERAQKAALTAAQQNQTAAYLIARGKTPAEAAQIAGNPTVLSAELQRLNKDPSVVEVAGKKYSLLPGEKPSDTNLLGAAKAEDDTEKWVYRDGPVPGSIIAINKGDPTNVKVSVAGQPYAPPTPEQRSAFGLNPNEPYKMGPKGPESIGGGNTNVSVDLGNKAAGVADKAIIDDTLKPSYDKTQGAIGTLKAIERQKRDLDGGMITGWGSDWKQKGSALIASLLGVPDEKLANTQDFLAASSQKAAELAKTISQAGHTTNMDLQLGATIAGGDPNKMEEAIRKIVDAQEVLARDQIDHHNKLIDKYQKVVGAESDLGKRVEIWREEQPEIYRFKPRTMAGGGTGPDMPGATATSPGALPAAPEPVVPPPAAPPPAANPLVQQRQNALRKKYNLE